jgi:bilirubin oxidase
MVVNGRAWPYLEVTPHRYRLRILNGCNARTLMLSLENGQSFFQIGGDQGFLPAPVELKRLLIAPAERADVIIDFAGLPVGTRLTLLNIGPDAPYGGGQPGVDFVPSDAATTGQVMQFRVVRPKDRNDESTPLSRLRLPRLPRLGAPDVTRYVSLNELGSNLISDADGNPFGPRQALCGILTPDGKGQPLTWSDPVSENPQPDTTEVWAICNFTEDAHPIHVHDVAFEVLSREPMGNSDPTLVRGPELWEVGPKDTVIAYPGEITRIKMRFTHAGLYVWHCHIIDHEDNEMMRPYVIGPIPQLLADRSQMSGISPEATGFFCILKP